MIYFSDFSTAGGGDITVAVQDFQTGTGTGLKSFTSTALSGVTPKAALILGGRALVSSGSAETPFGVMTLAGVDASGSSGIVTATRDNYPSAWVRKGGWASPSNTFNVDSGAGGTVNQGLPALISGGISINFSTNSQDQQCHYMAFAGNDVEAASGRVALGTGTSAIAVNCGFQPDAVIFFGVGNNFPSAMSGSQYAYSFGVATSDGTQRGVIGAEAHAADPTAPYQTLLTDAVGGEISTAGALIYKLVVGGFSSTGFEVTPSASAGSDSIAYLALKFTNGAVKLQTITTPTTTGNQVITGAGFQPQAVLGVLTNLEATDAYPGSTSDNQSGLSIFTIDASQARSIAIRNDAGAGTTDTGTNNQPKVLQPSATTTAAGQATLTSFDSDGMTLNWSAVQGTAKKGFILFIE